MATQRKQISRRGIIFVIVVIALLAMFIVGLIVFRPGSSEKGVIETTPYALDSSASQRFSVMDGDLAVASGGGLQLFDENGSLVPATWAARR